MPDAEGDVRAAAGLRGWWRAFRGLGRLNWPVPDLSTLCRPQKDLAVTIPCRPSPCAPRLPIGGTGIQASKEGKGSPRKHGCIV